MNIPVKTFDGRIYCRPDASRDKEDKDIYLPDHVSGYYYVPVVFMKMGRAGKCIARRFVPRYTDSYGVGVLLYESSGYESGDIAVSSCLDHTSIIPVLTRPLSELDNFAAAFTAGTAGPETGTAGTATGAAESCYRIEIDGATADTLPCGRWRDILTDTIVSVTAKLTVHIGDFVCAELCPPKKLQWAEKENVLSFKGVLNDEQIFNFSFISQE